jgi:DNA modification methylase
MGGRSQSAKKPPGMKLEEWPLDRFRVYERNPRAWGDGVVERMCRAISDFGFRVPILARSTGDVIDGHLRLKAAQKLGLATALVLIADDMTEAQIKAFRISVNQAATWADWNLDLLKLEIGDLQALNLDLGSLGFDDAQLADIMRDRSAGLTDPEDAPEPPSSPVSRLGDVWLLGEHRLACGDSTAPAAAQSAFGAHKPNLMVTDPPYGVNYDAGWRNRVHRRDGSLVGGLAVGRVMNDEEADWRGAYALFRGDVVYAWHAGLHANTAQASLEAVGFQMRAQIIWAKQQFAIGRGDYHFQHEPCWYAVRKGKTGHWASDRKQTTLWAIDKPQRSETGHSTQKPVECMKRPMDNNSKPGDAVYDPFIGSGTSIIAAEMSGRICLGIELSPAYCDLSLLRWQAFRGGEARLEATGQTFAEVKAERLGADAPT